MTDRERARLRPDWWKPTVSVGNLIEIGAMLLLFGGMWFGVKANSDQVPVLKDQVTAVEKVQVEHRGRIEALTRDLAQAQAEMSKQEQRIEKRLDAIHADLRTLLEERRRP